MLGNVHPYTSRRCFTQARQHKDGAGSTARRATALASNLRVAAPLMSLSARLSSLEQLNLVCQIAEGHTLSTCNLQLLPACQHSQKVSSKPPAVTGILHCRDLFLDGEVLSACHVAPLCPAIQGLRGHPGFLARLP